MNWSVFQDRSEWRYARVVLVLLVLAGVASKGAVVALESNPAFSGIQDAIPLISTTILALTMGFLFLSGAFGIWAIRTTEVLEGKRRFGKLVDDMDFLVDGIVLVAPDGSIRAMNAAARALTGGEINETYENLHEAFPCLTADDVDVLLHSPRTREVERVSREGHALYSLRFRSQPASDLCILLVSDVTAAKTRQMRELQACHFQLIGRIARGVSHDFNNILCAISANANLLNRPDLDPESLQAAAEIITKEAERGSSLARQIINLSSVDAPGQVVTDLEQHVESAAELLRVVLPKLWTIRTTFKKTFGAIPMAAHQFEQLLLNLGLHAAEEFSTPGTLCFEVRPGSWEKGGSRDVEISVAGYPAGVEPNSAESGKLVPVEDAGVIESIVRSVVESVGGRIRILASHDGHHRYILTLPGLQAVEERTTARTGLTDKICEDVRDWHVLLARHRDGGWPDLEHRMKGLGIRVEFATDLVVVLGRMESRSEFDAAVIDRRLLGGDTADALLKAILKLKPDLGLVVLCESVEDEASTLRSDIAYEALDAATDTILHSMVRAQQLAASRGEQPV